MYPWQTSQWLEITGRKQLPHALLLRGNSGIGKHAFAFFLAKALLCSNPHQTNACDTCSSCIWFVEGNHPDFRVVSPEEASDDSENPPEIGGASTTKKKKAKKSQISVEQIRTINDYLSLSIHQTNSRRVIVISPAETLNVYSANALLKTLEEPPINTLFLLVSSQPQRLLPTIISRCQAIDMELPTKDIAIKWLNEQSIENAQVYLDYAGGAPLLAQQIAQDGDATSNLINFLKLGAKLDPFASAPLFLKIGMDRAITMLQKWIFDLSTYKLTKKLHYHTQHSSSFQAIANSVNFSLLLNFQKMLNEAKMTVNHPLSNQLQLENILTFYTCIFDKLPK